ncbi:44849_t:CDS:2, partial [Gigaspora margarita]
MDCKGFSNLEVLNCSNNLLTDIDFSDLNPEKLKEIDLKNNKLSTRNLTCFSKFVNLLHITVDISFHGSLEPLKNLDNLYSITIAGTNIDSGLEYLPVSVHSTGFINESSSFGHTLSRPSSCENLGSQKIFAQLKEYFTLTSYSRERFIVLDDSVFDIFYNEKYALEAWRVENILEYRKKKYERLEQIIKSEFHYLKSRLTKLEETFEQQIKPLDLKNLIPQQIKERKAEITNILCIGKGTSAHLHDEIKEMRRKLSDYKKLEQYLQGARNINIDLEKIRLICKEDKTEIYKGAYKELKRMDETVLNMFRCYKKMDPKLHYYEIALK